MTTRFHITQFVLSFKSVRYHMFAHCIIFTALFLGRGSTNNTMYHYNKYVGFISMVSLALLRLYAGLLHITFVCFFSRNIRHCLNNMNRSLLWVVQKMFGRSCLYKKGVVRIYRYWKTCETVSLVSGSHRSKTSYKSMGNSNMELVMLIWASILKQTERVASTVRIILNSNNYNYRPA